MRKSLPKYRIAALLIVLSLAFFAIQHVIFDNPTEAGFLFFQDLAFMPLHVLIVTFILESIIKEREKRERLEQLNIVVSAFFSEVGMDAIRAFNPYIKNMDDIASYVKVTGLWEGADFKAAASKVIGYHFEADCKAGDLEETRQLLSGKKSSILAMFENPNLLENSRFTSMLWAIYHVMDELNSRDGFWDLPETDYDHLSVDIERAYKLLVIEWLFYMKHLKGKYPYLFSLALRKNPFADNKSVIVY